MRKLNSLSTDMIRYIVIFIVVMTLVMFVPNNRMSIKDSTLLTIIITLTISVLENINTIFFSDNSTENFDLVGTTDTTNNDKTVVLPQQNTNIQPVQSVQQEQKMTDTEDNKKYTDVPHDDIYKHTNNSEQKDYNGTRVTDDVNKTDMPYTDYHHIPVSDDYKSSEMDYGYSFLPPENWYKTSPFPPVCVSEKRSSICPSYTTGTPLDVKEWDNSRKITGPAGINTQYIKDTLNAGK